MDWEQAVARRLLTDSAVAALVGSRVDWNLRPHGSALPALVLTLASDPRPQTLAGFTTRRESRVQVDCHAATRGQAVALREAAIAALVQPGTFDGVGFGRGFIEIARSGGEHTESGFVHTDSFDILLWHE